MADFDNIMQKAKEVAGMAVVASVELYRTAEEKAKLFAKMTKLKTEIAMDKAHAKKLYTAIGMTYFKMKRESPEPEFERRFAELEYVLGSIDAKEAELLDLKTPPDDFDDEDDDIEIEVEVKAEADDGDSAAESENNDGGAG